MTRIKTWWANKPQHKKNNWFTVALGVLVGAACLVETSPLLALATAAPTLVLVWLEVKS